jgi:hypothetical protein
MESKCCNRFPSKRCSSKRNISCFNYVLKFSSYRGIIYMWNLQFDALFSLPCSALHSNRYLLNRDGNPVILDRFWLNFPETQWLLIRLQISNQEMKQGINLHTACIDHVAIPWKFKYFIGAKVVGTLKWNCSPVRTLLWTRWVPLFSL